jgi:hypothetical protein
MKKWAEENKTRWIRLWHLQRWSKIYTLQLIPECSCMLKKPFLHGQPQEEFFNQSRIIKRSFCQHFLCRNSKFLIKLWNHQTDGLWWNHG